MRRQRWAVSLFSSWRRTSGSSRHALCRCTTRCRLLSTASTPAVAAKHSATVSDDHRPPLLPPASSGLQLPPHTFTTRIPRPFPLSLHNTPLPHLDVNWSITGNPTGPTIFILPSMSHSSLVTRPRHLRSSSPSSSQPATTVGWWESVVGWGSEYGIDLNTFQVLSASSLGAPFGTSSPLSLQQQQQQSTHSAYRASFPRITPLDQANAHHAVLQHLITNPQLLPPPRRLTLPLYAIVGSSMGGMSVIQFATRFPTLFRRALLICSTPLTSPSTQALRSIQRSAIRLDPHYSAGQYSQPPHRRYEVGAKAGHDLLQESR